MEKKAHFSIGGMHCISCADIIKKGLQGKRGILECNVQFATEKAHIVYDSKEIDEKEIIDLIQKTGYEVIEHSHHQESSSQDFWVAFFLSLPFLFSMVIGETLPPRVELALATIVQFFCGRGFYKSSYHALKSRTANMDLLIALGTSAAYFYSVFSLWNGGYLYFESSVLIITLVLLGRLLEKRSKKRASEAIEKLLSLGPKSAFVKRGDSFIAIPISEVVKGDLLRIRPGDLIPVDGVVIEGESSVSEASITGESLPVYKEKGLELYAGSQNQNGSLVMEARAVGDETVAHRMALIVEHAQSSRAPIQSLADTISEWFVPFVVVVSLITFMVWYMLTLEVGLSLMHAVAVLVIACPCALGLATPIVIVVASGKGALRGVLFREARAIEEAQKIKTLIVDKTGTITEGKPVVMGVIPFAIEKEEALKIAASLAHYSTHPLSEAIVKEAERRGYSLEPVTQFLSIPGKGVKGMKRGTEYFLGSSRLAYDEDIVPESSSTNESEVFLFTKEKLLASIFISDPIRPTSKEAVSGLKALGISLVMVTGDKEEVGKHIAKEVGIDKVIGGVLPEKKAEIVSSYKESPYFVGMVGDGVNDAPALAVADVSFAIGSGSDIAIETADVTLLKGDLKAVLYAIKLSRDAVLVIKQNLFFAFIYNVLGIPLAAFGLLSPIFASAAMGLSSLSVVLNSLRLKNKR